MSDSKSSKPAHKKNGKQKYCHCKPTCGKLLSERGRRHHYSLILDRSTIGSSESGDESDSDSDSEDDSWSQMEVDPPSSNHHETFNFVDIPNLLGLDQDDNAAMEIDKNASPAEYASESEHEYDGGLDFNDPDDDEWKEFDEEDDQDIPISREEMLRELEAMLNDDEAAALWDVRNKTLTEQDRVNISAFQLKMISNMPRVAFCQMRHAFRRKLEISSMWVMIHRIAILSGIEPQWYHCCPNSCMAYTGAYADLQCCRYCQQPRLNSASKPRRLFCYLPLIPRLQEFFMSPVKVEQLRYRHNYVHKPGTISDVFDCEHYQQLLTQKVVVDGKELAHNYFSGEYDVALGFCTDSYLLFERRRKGPSATPLLADLYSFPPEIRTHLLDLMCCGVIAGPKGPKDQHSYLVPLDAELVQLAIGVPTFNCVTRQVFDLRAYNIFGMENIFFKSEEEVKNYVISPLVLDLEVWARDS